MTNEELDRARVEEAWNKYNTGHTYDTVELIAARLARENWTPPVAVDPDLAEAKYMAQTARAERLTRTGGDYDLDKLAFIAIKAGRELERAEVKPGLVWVKHDGSGECPVYKGAWVWFKEQRITLILQAQYVNWRTVTHYAIITPPAEDVA